MDNTNSNCRFYSFLSLYLVRRRHISNENNENEELNTRNDSINRIEATNETTNGNIFSTIFSLFQKFLEKLFNSPLALLFGVIILFY